MSRFDYVKYDEDSTQDQLEAKSICEKLEAFIDGIKSENPQATGRAVALAHTKLEECYMWIGKAIRDNQIAKNGSAELQESRG